MSSEDAYANVITGGFSFIKPKKKKSKKRKQEEAEAASASAASSEAPVGAHDEKNEDFRKAAAETGLVPDAILSSIPTHCTASPIYVCVCVCVRLHRENGARLP